MDRRAILAEAVGTFGLVLLGTGAVVYGRSTDSFGTLGFALAFALAVALMIFLLGGYSGAQINPAVTIGLWLAGYEAGERVAPFVAAQSIGALLGSVVVRLLAGNRFGLGGTVPTTSAWIAWLLESMLSLLLMSAILIARARGLRLGTAALLIGGVVGIEALLAGPWTGASMNPARSLGPAVVSGQGASLWIYLTAPIVGAWLAVALCRRATGGICCSRGR